MAIDTIFVDAEFFERSAAAKQASRDRDAARLASGEITREQLREENDAFRALTDMEIVAIGKRPMRVSR